MYKISNLFTKFNNNTENHDENFTIFIDFLNKLATDNKYGLVFPNDKLWQKDSNLGVAIEVHNKTFKVANKLLYTLITSLKPHESNAQLQFIIRTLNNCQELIPPYMNYLVQHGGGYHDPSLTSWWIAYSLLYTNALQLPLPSIIADSSNIKYDAKLISENIAFAPLSKNALTNGLTNQKPLIVQLTLQIILYMLKKLETVLDLTNDVRQELLDLVFSQLPDLSTFSQVLLNEKLSSSKLIKVTALTIVTNYEKLLPASSSNNNSIQKIVSSGISSIVSNTGETNFNTFELTLLDLYMQIHNQDFKWWNKLNNSSNSFFTSLIKLCTKSNIDQSFVLKIYQLLNKLCVGKMLFNDNLLITPIMALIFSMESKSNDNVDDVKIFNMLDETISRTVRTPYKYLDLSHKSYNDTSIFVVALFEQFKFILASDTSNDGNIKWLFNFVKYLILIGESKSSLLELVKTLDIADQTLELTDNNQTVNKTELKDSSIMEIVLNSSLTDLISKNLIDKKIISSNLDFLAALLLINSLIQHPKPAKQLLETIYSKIWGFLTNSSTQVVNYFTSEKTWRPLFEEYDNDTENLKIALNYYNEIIANFPKVGTDSLGSFLFKKYSVNDTKFVQFMWILKDSQLVELLQNEGISNKLYADVVSTCVDKKLPITYRQFTKIFNDDHSETRNEILTNLINYNLIEFADDEQLNDLIDKVTSTEENYFLIECLAQKKSTSIITKLLSTDFDNDELNCMIASAVSKQALVPIPQTFLEKVSKIVISKIKNNSFGELTWSQMLSILSLQDGQVSSDISDLIFSKIDLKKSFIPEFINFLTKCELNENVKTWLHKSMLYVTKKFAESSTLSEEFNLFLVQLISFLKTSNIWSVVPPAILNTQIEVILKSKFVSLDELYLKYLIELVSIAAKSNIEYQKIFQICLLELQVFFKNYPTEESKARYYASILLYILFNFNHSKLSTSINLQLLVEHFYLGTNLFEDLIIKKILIKMEAKVSISWISSVTNWEFIEGDNSNDMDLIGQDRLIVNNNGIVTLTLNKQFIKNSLTSNQVIVPDTLTNLADFDNFYESNSSMISTTSISYDYEFLLMLMLNSEELLKFNKEESIYTFNIKNIIESGLLQFVIVSLANPSTQEIAKIIITKILSSLDKNIYKIYLSSTLFTLRKLKNDTNHPEIAYLVWYVWCQFVPILSNPGHFLYEKIFRYVLSTPYLKSYEIPLFNSIIYPDLKHSSSDDFYIGQLSWILSVMNDALSTASSLNLPIMEKILEFLLNLINVEKYLNIKNKSMILEIIYKISKLEHGSDLLITRFGILSFLELFKNGDDGVVVAKQLIVNIDEIVLNLGVSTRGSKRINNWTDGELVDNLKRIHR
ncbi:URB1 Nucleolar pre-ribosomal-associated protein 1 [Candida maltosa Xu316]